MSEPREITIVSGLPRSGTSLMMQMLSLGGLELLTDGVRVADTDNPKGYYEFERVKKITADKAWLPDARGKAVKMISQLLYDLPNNESYKVIFMRRNVDEVIASQEKMLLRRGVSVPDPAVIKSAFSTHLEKLFAWLATQSGMDLLEVDYKELVTNPAEPTNKISAFIAQDLNVDQMLTAVDPSLYRNREHAGSG